ncbi:MAG: DUF4097 family beta strand repeat protein [Clostridiales bacterium]|nr:DUF4097 family beta strand repeat protein [Clostridiales bacterium]
MKTLKIIILIILSIGVVGIIGGLIAVLSGNLQLPSVSVFSETIELSDETFDPEGIEEIDIKVASSDVVFCRSEDGQFRVLYKGPSKEESDPLITAEKDSDKLVIRQRTRWMPLFINIGGAGRVVTVFIPESFTGSVTYKCASGDLDLTEDFVFDEFDASVASGDMRFGRFYANSASVETTSGDLFFGHFEVPEYSIKSSSGDITIDKIDGTGTVKAISGNIEIDDYCGKGIISTTSGDVTVAVQEATGDISIQVISGEVDVAVATGSSFSVDFSLVSGDIFTDVPLNNAHVTKRATTGTVGDRPEYRLEVKTTSGDIRFYEK